MKPTRHELLDALAALTDDELETTLAEARGGHQPDTTLRDLTRALFGTANTNDD